MSSVTGACTRSLSGETMSHSMQRARAVVVRHEPCLPARVRIPECVGQRRQKDLRTAASRSWESRRRTTGDKAETRDWLGGTIYPRSRKSKGRSGNAYKVLALQVELSLPRLIASRVEARRCLLAFDRGSGSQGQSNHSTPRSRRPRVFPTPG